MAARDAGDLMGFVCRLLGLSREELLGTLERGPECLEDLGVWLSRLGFAFSEWLWRRRGVRVVFYPVLDFCGGGGHCLLAVGRFCCGGGVVEVVLGRLFFDGVGLGSESVEARLLDWLDGIMEEYGCIGSLLKSEN